MGLIVSSHTVTPKIQSDFGICGVVLLWSTTQFEPVQPAADIGAEDLQLHTFSATLGNREAAANMQRICIHARTMRQQVPF